MDYADVKALITDMLENLSLELSLVEDNTLYVSLEFTPDGSKYIPWVLTEASIKLP